VTEPRVLVFAYHDVGFECLDVLIQRGVNVVAVLTHADAPGERIWFRSVATLARQHSIPVHTPEYITTLDWFQKIREWEPDLIFSFYYRHMIPMNILQLAGLGAYNMHGSLLPKYRGRVPINWAIIHGESQTGVTLHVMEKRADAGDIVDQQAVPIPPEASAREVFAGVTAAARAVLERQLDNLLAGKAPRRAQDESQATYFGGRRPEDGRIDLSRDARSIFNLIRAVTHPYPGAFTDYEGKRFYIWWARPVEGPRGQPGEVLSEQPLLVATGNGCLEVAEWQWVGEHPSRAADHGLRIGTKLGAGF